MQTKLTKFVIYSLCIYPYSRIIGSNEYVIENIVNLSMLHKYVNGSSYLTYSLTKINNGVHDRRVFSACTLPGALIQC